MTVGTYLTSDPNKRVKLILDEVYPTEIPGFPYAEGVLEDLQKCYEEGNYYGAILLEREQWARITEDEDGNVTLHDYREVWEEADSIWSCAGYDDPAKDIARK